MAISGLKIDEVRSALRLNAESFAIHLCGEPNRKISNRRTLRFGRNGSLSIEIAGRKAGLWYDFEAGVGGDLIDLTRQTRHCDFVEAVSYAADFLGISLDGDVAPLPPLPQKSRAPESRQKTQADDQDRQGKIDAARAIWNESVPIGGTVGERYLIDTRRIPSPEGGWPASVIRFHPTKVSLVFAATRLDGTVQAIQQVRLGADARKASDGGPVKLSRGPQDGAVVRLPGPPHGPLLMTEGPETGITAWVAGGLETWIALGSMAKLELPAGRRIIVCADDDPRHPKEGKDANAYKGLRDAVARWCGEGLDVVLLYPWPIRRENKTDLNDVLRSEGIGAVRARIDLALNPPRLQVERVSLDAARARMDEEIGNFFRVAVPATKDLSPEDASKPQQYAHRDWTLGLFQPRPPPEPPPPQVVALRVDVGVGKSETARQHMVRFLQAIRQAGSKKTVVMAVPTHALADEQVTKVSDAANAAGLTVHSWRGRRAPDPDHTDKMNPAIKDEHKTKMCLDLEAVELAEQALVDIQTSVCRRKLENGDIAQCEHYDDCGYQRQLQVAADLWFVPHQLLFSKKPEPIGKVAALIIDEGFANAGVRPEANFPIDLFETRPPVPKKPDDTDRLLFLEQLVIGVLRHQPNGQLISTNMVEAGLTVDGALEAARLEWERKLDVEMYPGMPHAARKAVVEATKSDRFVVQRVDFWRALADLLKPDGPKISGWLAVGQDSHGARAIFLKGRRDIAAGWQSPTLILDATLRIETIRPFYPNVDLVADIAVALPHQHIRQVVDRPFSKQMLIWEGPGRGPKASSEALRRLGNLKDSRRRVILESRRVAPGRVLVVAQKDVEEALLALGPLPPNIVTAHHNAVAGRDEWRDVALLVVVGRTMPSPSAVNAMAEAISGHAINDLPGWYERHDAVRLVAGTTELTEADRHPDPLAEALRWQIAEGQLLQIIGRGRGVTRTAENPLEVLVLCDLALPLPITATLSAEDLTLGPAEQMLLEAGVALENPAHAFRSFPGMWASAEATRKAFQRTRSGTIPYYYSLIWDCPTPLRAVTYRLTGAGQKDTVAWVDPAVMPDLLGWIEQRLGPLAFVDVAPGTPSQNTFEAGGKKPQPPDGGGPQDQQESRSGANGMAVMAPIVPPLLHPATFYPLAGVESVGLLDTILRFPCGRGLDAYEADLSSGPAVWIEADPWPPTDGTVETMAAVPPWPDDFTAQQPPVAGGQLALMSSNNLANARRRLKELDLRLWHARPPLVWGDADDARRVAYWRERMAKIRAARGVLEDAAAERSA